MNKKLLWLVVLVCTQGISLAQDRRKELRMAANERSLEELLTAIETHDGGGYDLVAVAGLLPSGSEPHSKFKQVLRDPRVGKIYSILEGMPKEEAASVVSASFDKSLSKLKSISEKGGVSQTLNYGLHAKLWLSFQFESKGQFNSKFRSWHNWYVDQIVSGDYFDHLKEMSKSSRKKLFADSFSPELLMYMNLVLVDQSSSGDLGKFETLLRDSGYDLSLSRSINTIGVYPPDAEEGTKPLAEVPCFAGWAGLDSLGTEQRAMLVSKAQDFIDPKGPVHEAISQLAELLLKETGLSDLEKKSRGGEVEKVPVGLRFIGSESKSFLSQGWTPMFAPSKERVLASADRMYKLTPQSERDEWDANIEAMKSWLSELPESGIEIEGEKIWEWPKAGKDGEKSSRRIRLVIRDFHAFDETSNKAKKERPKNKLRREPTPIGKPPSDGNGPDNGKPKTEESKSKSYEGDS